MNSQSRAEEGEEIRDQLQSLSASLQSAREEERKAVAREIHDELGQALTTMKLELSLLKDEIASDAAAAIRRVQELKENIDETIQAVKRIISKLRPRLLDDLGLAAAVEWQANDFQHYSGIVCEMVVDPEEMEIDGEISTAIFRIFQETLTNIARHSGATRVTASLMRSGNFLELQVRDNGRGISKSQIGDSKSFGLIGIRERARHWNGSVEISGEPNKGTTVTVRIPLSAAAV
jgi:signal transduction histidine kinase